MTMQADPPTLIQRFEAAEEGSDLLDMEIDVALGLFKPPPGYTRDTASPHAWRKPGLVHYQRQTPYTQSLDAALALVERVLPGTMWRVGFDPDDGSIKAELVTPAPDCRHASANHNTGPLALCIALLRVAGKEG